MPHAVPHVEEERRRASSRFVIVEEILPGLGEIVLGPRPRARGAGAIDQLLDALFGAAQLALEEARQDHALLEALDRLLEGELAVLEILDDGLEPLERLLEGERPAVGPKRRRRRSRCGHRISGGGRVALARTHGSSVVDVIVAPARPLAKRSATSAPGPNCAAARTTVPSGNVTRLYPRLRTASGDSANRRALAPATRWTRRACPAWQASARRVRRAARALP